MHVGSIDPLSTPIEVNPRAFDAMLRAAVAAGGLEACGLLFGDSGRIEAASIAPNVADDPRRRFEIDPAQLFDGHRRGRAGPHRLLGCWHSHPNGAALPSSADRAGVHDLGWLWLIVAGGGIRAFRPTHHGFDEVALIPSPL